jgi:hypothetical protein
MLIAEDLLLLLTRDDTGQPVAGSQTLAFGLAGGVLVELALAGRVDIAAAGDRVKEGRVVIRDPSPTGDELLDEALAALCQREGKKPSRSSERCKGVSGTRFTPGSLTADSCGESPARCSGFFRIPRGQPRTPLMRSKYEGRSLQRWRATTRRTPASVLSSDCCRL